MKKAPSKLLALLLAVVMVVSVMAPAAVIAAPAGDARVTEVSLPEQDWQMNRAFPNGTDDTLAINSLGSWNGYRDQGEIYVTLDSKVESLRLFVNNVEIETEGMVGGKTYKVDIADIAVDGINTVQVSNVAPVGNNKIVTVRVGYPVVIEGEPEDVGMDSSTLDLIDDFMNASVKYGFSGAQIAVIKDGKMVKNSAYGHVNGWNADGTQISEEDGVDVTTETLYDLASNTKMYSVNYAIQYLYEQGQLDLNTKIMDIFGYDEFIEPTIFVDLYGKTDAPDLETAKEWKTRITVKDVLMHQAGFKADYMYHNNYFNQTTATLDYSSDCTNALYAQGREDGYKMVMASPLEYEPGTKTTYSDTDYMLLCFVIEKITGMRLDEYLDSIFWTPMGLDNITYNPLENGWTVDQCAATELDGNKRADLDNLGGYDVVGKDLVTFNNMRDGVCQGTVHDEKCYYTMDGISGHAGMYANAEDLAKLCSVMLTGGYGENHYFSSSTIEQFVEAKSLDYTQWGLGWWREGELSRKSYWTTQSSNESFGHQGWTGTLTLIDPEEDLVVVLLTNKKNSPVLAAEKGSNDFWADNMLAGALNIAMGYVYDSINSTPEAVDASVHQLAIERIWVAASHGGAYDMNAHMGDAFAMTDLVVTRAEKRPTAQNVGYAIDAVETCVDQLAGLFEYEPYNEPNVINEENYDKWAEELQARVDALEITDFSEPVYAMTPVATTHEAVKGVGSNLKYSSAEGGDQNAVYFPRTSSNRSTSHCFNNSITWFEGFEGQGTVYVSINTAYPSMRIFINGHEVDTSSMLNKTGVFEIDVSDYTVNGRNLFQITDTGYGASRSTILFLVNNPEVIEGEAEDVGINPAVFEMIDRIVSNDVEHGFTSAQMAIVKDGVLIETNAWGAANSYHSDGTRINVGDADYVAVTDETLYDLASNSKMYSVNYALQKLVSDGKIKLSTKIVDLFPEFATGTIFNAETSEEQAAKIVEWKKTLTIQNILEHQAGFPADPQYHNDNFSQVKQSPENGTANELFSQDRATTKTMVLATPLTYEPGTKTVYSDVDYMLLCFVIEQVTGKGIDQYLKETFWDPMGLTSITYNPLDNGFTKDQTAATELNGNSRDGVISFANMREGVIQGTVHDEKAYYAMDGISGHAGLYSNAITLAKLAQVMQNYNGYGQTRLANYETNRYFAGRKEALAQWGMGWWRQGNYQRPWYFGQQAPSTTIGHQGWTGTLSSIDTENNLTTVYLTNKINSPVTDNKSNANKFDGNWYTASSLGFVPTLIYMGMDEFNAADDIQPALDAMLIDMAVIKMNRVVGNGTTDITHPNLLSAYAIMEAAAEMVAERPTEENLAAMEIALASMRRKYTEEEMAGIYEILGMETEPTRVEKLVAEMSLRDKVTQMMMVDFRMWGSDVASAKDFTVMNDEVRKIIEDYNFGSIILFANNIKETEQSYNLTMAMQEAATKDGGLALIICADQEGGSVYRLGSGTALPGNMALGATYAANGTKYALHAGQIIGSELSILGINGNLAPVVDVNNNANNPVIGLRSYGDDSTMVGELASAVIAGMAEYNVIGTAKHFPGHGDTATDSHYGLPMVDKSLDELLDVELKPYEVAIDQGIEMIMTAHILYPQLEGDKIVSNKTGEAESLPATMSDDILTGLLKEQMGFEGIVVTDAMNMAGIADKWDQVQSVVIAVNAGVDLFCMPCRLYCQADLANLDAIINGVIAAVESGEIPMERIDDAVTRILTVKENRGILDYNAEDYSLEEALEVVGSDENRAKERELAAAAVTVIKNENNTLPLKLTENSKVLMLVPYNNETAQMLMGWNRAAEAGLIPAGAEVDYYRFSNATINAELQAKLDWADTYIINSEISSTSRFSNNHWLYAMPTKLCDYAAANGKTAIISSVDKPYDVQMYANASAIVAAYGCKGSSVDPTEAIIGGATGSEAAYGPNIIAAVEVILGTYGAQGKLPVNIPVYDFATNKYTTEIAYERGYGLTYEAKEPIVVAEGWSGYTTWKLLANGTLTFTPTEQKLEDGQTNLKNYWKVNGVLTLPWGAYADQITKVVIEEGIHDIGQMAFYELPNLVEVVLPESAVEIRNYAFKNCKALTTINLEVVEFVREGAFYGCSALENITFAEGVVIEDWAFSHTPVAIP